MLVVQAVVGLYNGTRRMTAVHAPPASHPHEAIGPLKVKKMVFHHQAVAAYAGHDCPPWYKPLLIAKE
jgi:hypothetical protein